MKPKVAILGRPNVGKSTLFNRILGRTAAIVEDQPGITRDRQYADTEWAGRAFTLVDTGGFFVREKDPLLAEVGHQAEEALVEANVAVFVVDGRAGRVTSDEEIARALHESGKPVVLAANKIDTARGENDSRTHEFFRLGFGEPCPISAEHARGIDLLLDRVVERFVAPGANEPDETSASERAVRIAVLGRPNVGKSTLINALLAKKRLVVAPLPGSTRDPIDCPVRYHGRSYLLTDTAGLRRRSNVHTRVEKLSTKSALDAMERADVVALVLDATLAAVDEEAKIADAVVRAGKPLLLVVNKWDLAPTLPGGEARFRQALKERFQFVAFAPVIFVSALNGTKVDKILERAGPLDEETRLEVSTPRMNQLLRSIVDEHPAPVAGGRPIRLYYAAQVATSPLTFMFTSNAPAAVPDSYRRFIENRIREAFSLKVPVRLLFRGRPGQAKRQARKRVRR